MEDSRQNKPFYLRGGDSIGSAPQSTPEPPAVPVVELRVAPELVCGGYDRAAFSTYDRAAIVRAQHAQPSFYLARDVPQSGTGFDVEHVVAAKEACESGLPRSQWGAFGRLTGSLTI